MSAPVKMRIVKIGNSQGIRIPKVLLDQAGLAGEIEVEAQTGQLILRPAQSVRHSWEAQFAAMAEAGDDALLDGDTVTPTSWEDYGWRW